MSSNDQLGQQWENGNRAQVLRINFNGFFGSSWEINYSWLIRERNKTIELMMLFYISIQSYRSWNRSNWSSFAYSNEIFTESKAKTCIIKYSIIDHSSHSLGFLYSFLLQLKYSLSPRPWRFLAMSPATAAAFAASDGRKIHWVQWWWNFTTGSISRRVI